MKAVCPNNKNHNEFITVAYVSQDWVVDSEGEFIRECDCENQTLHRPNSGNEWTCGICGEQAIVTD